MHFGGKKTLPVESYQICYRKGEREEDIKEAKESGRRRERKKWGEERRERTDPRDSCPTADSKDYETPVLQGSPFPLQTWAWYSGDT